MNNTCTQRYRSSQVALVVEGRYATQAQPAGLRRALRAIPRLDVVELSLDASRAPAAAFARCDLVVARGRSSAVLETLARAEAMSIATINRAGAIASVVNKVTMHELLVAAGVAVPATWTGSIATLRRRLADYDDALVIKPAFGDNGRDVYIVPDGRALGSVAWREPIAIVQRYIANDGYDVKLYCIGDRVWTVRKPSPLHATISASESQLLATTADHVAIARRCACAFGLDLFGVDCIATADGLVVIEVNDFPNYTGIAQANDALAAFVMDRLRQPALAVTA